MLVPHEMEEILLHLFLAKLVGKLLEVAGEEGHPHEVVPLGMLTESPQLQESRLQTPYDLSTTGFLQPLTEPDVHLLLCIRLSRGPGVVRPPHPLQFEPFYSEMPHQKLLFLLPTPHRTSRVYATEFPRTH